MKLLRAAISSAILAIACAVILTSNVVYGVSIGTYDCSDFSTYSRDMEIGSGIDAGDVISIGGFNALALSGDTEYIKTADGIPGFTYQSDWSWMAIIRSDQRANYRVFMRGMAWADKPGDFDLRLAPDSSTTNMNTWQRTGGWQDMNCFSDDIAYNTSDLIWLAGTYDYDEQSYRLYVNGNLVGGPYTAIPMDDRSNTNPVNINGQWANNKYNVGDVYVEGSFTFAQLILSQSTYSQDVLQSCYNSGAYMPSDADTWLDVRVRDTSAPVPEPGTVILLFVGLIGLVGFRKRFNL
jgi:hypothetical protein